jgi:hypothetical protein
VRVLGVVEQEQLSRLQRKLLAAHLQLTGRNSQEDGEPELACLASALAGNTRVADMQIWTDRAEEVGLEVELERQTTEQ